MASASKEAKTLAATATAATEEPGPPACSDDACGGSVLLWSRAEAAQRSSRQLESSGCGPTAALDVLRLLGVEASASRALETAPPRQRAYDEPLL
mmetsp:Transcript_33455/g.99598  ORF Transcript_33455/g.99598 Transcript_33455/m.99598 type:complete len:95 (-) Transcript_33455:23-307(-)|eukprot:48543-Chlamydomonas_euryale.AAC.1